MSHVVAGIDAWSELCSQAYVPLSTDAAPDFRGAMHDRSVGRLGVSQIGSTAATIRRNVRLTRREPREAMLLSIMLAGSVGVRQSERLPDRPSQVPMGAAYLLESDRPYEVRLPARYDMVTLLLPRDGIRLREEKRRALAGQPIPQSDVLDVLRNHLARLLAREDGGDDRAEEAVTLELLRGVIRAQTHPHVTPDRLSPEAQLAHARWFLAEHRADHDLTIDAAADWLHVSRRHLENRFAEKGESPASYLRTLRVDRATTLLSADAGLSIGEAAQRSGFSDVNTFIRSFRRLHGTTPAAWRRGHRTRRPRTAAARLLSPLPGTLSPHAPRSAMSPSSAAG